MGHVAQSLRVLVASFLAVALAWTPAVAQQARTVAGFIVNFGIVPAAVALRAEATAMRIQRDLLAVRSIC
jgi:hypothetical protein